MFKRCLLMVGFVLMLAAGVSVGAQEGSGEPCHMADVLDVEYQGMVQKEWLQSLIIILTDTAEDDDTTNWLSGAREMRRVLARLEANCRGLHFTSEDEGMEPVIGPVVIPNGIWRVTFTTAGFGSVKTEDLSGTCEDSGGIFNAFEGDAADGAQQVFTSGTACEVLIEVSNTSEPWTLMFELVKAIDE